MKKILLLLILLCCISSPVLAATYYVRTDGNNSTCDGSENSAAGVDGTCAWATIQWAEDHVARTSSDAIIRVQSGTYNESVTVNIATSGSNYITFVGEGATRPIVRQFVLGTSYVKMINFEITHTSTSYSGAIITSGSASYIQILDNYIHETYTSNGCTICTGQPATFQYWTIRGNTMYYADCIPGTWCRSGGQYDIMWIGGYGSAGATADHWLVEYNDFSRATDYLHVFGQYHAIRNNYLHDRSPTYWSDTGSYHVDISQAGSDSAQLYARNHLFENNFIADSSGWNDDHGMLQQDNANYGDYNIIFRGNVSANMGAGGSACVATNHCGFYNNTFYLMNITGYTIGTATVSIRTAFGDTAYYGVCINNLLANDASTGTNALQNETAPVGFIEANNIGYLAGSESSYVSTGNPNFVNTSTQDLRLGNTSSSAYHENNPAIAIATITSSGSGTSFAVAANTALRFTDIDGYGGIIEGDQITVNGTTTRITNITGDTITVADPLTWDNSEPVFWGPSATPDIGAYPYGHTPLTAATISNVGTTYTVAVTGDARGVWFYVDGVPTTWDYVAPYTATIASGTVTAKAYALYASKTPVVTAEAGISVPILQGITIIGGTVQ